MKELMNYDTIVFTLLKLSKESSLTEEADALIQSLSRKYPLIPFYPHNHSNGSPKEYPKGREIIKESRKDLSRGHPEDLEHLDRILS